MNAGGHPRNGIGLSSANYRMSLDAIGETPIAPVLFSTAYSMDVGFARCFPPPREVQQITVLDKTMFAWTPERSVGTYRVYRGDLHELPFGHGACPIADVGVEYVPLEEVPDVGEQFFYLVTAENTLLEEGIIGYDSAGAARAAAGPCP